MSIDQRQVFDRSIIDVDLDVDVDQSNVDVDWVLMLMLIKRWLKTRQGDWESKSFMVRLLMMLSLMLILMLILMLMIKDKAPEWPSVWEPSCSPLRSNRINTLPDSIIVEIPIILTTIIAIIIFILIIMTLNRRQDKFSSIGAPFSWISWPEHFCVSLLLGLLLFVYYSIVLENILMACPLRWYMRPLLLLVGGLVCL